MNAFNTTWDLLLNRPYGDGGSEDSRRVDPENGWTMLPPLYCRAHVNGPINDPSTPNGGWSVEIALPIAQLQERQEAAGCGAATPPAHGTRWRVGFSRVNWHVIVEDGRYVKDPERPHEDNWVWSPQGRVAMHEPEHWGFLQFSSDAVNTTAAAFEPEWPVRAVAMGVYWAQRLYAEQHGALTAPPQRHTRGSVPDEVRVLRRGSACLLAPADGLFASTLEELEDFTPPGLIDGTCMAGAPTLTTAVRAQRTYS